jgi:hypothetical protein
MPLQFFQHVHVPEIIVLLMKTLILEKAKGHLEQSLLNKWYFQV